MKLEHNNISVTEKIGYICPTIEIVELNFNDIIIASASGCVGPDACDKYDSLDQIFHI